MTDKERIAASTTTTEPTPPPPGSESRILDAMKRHIERDQLNLRRSRKQRRAGFRGPGGRVL